MNLLGIGLAAGSGERARPLTLKANDYLRSKAAIRFMGCPVIELQLTALRDGGISEYAIVAKGRENRFQIKTLVGYGDFLGIHLRYSSPMHDHLDRGSADATIRLAEAFDLRDDLLIFPVDSLFDLDVQGLWASHRERRNALTMVTTWVAGLTAVGTYGVVLEDSTGTVTGFLEKPAAETMEKYFGPLWKDRPVPVNAGLYLVNADLLRRWQYEPQIIQCRQSHLDFGHHLLPWLVASGYPLGTYPARWVGDLGNLSQYLGTMSQILEGEAVVPGLHLGRDDGHGRHIYGLPSTRNPDPDWQYVRLGRYSVVGQHCVLDHVSIGDECVIGDDVTLRNVHLDDGVMVGPGAIIQSSVAGLMADIRSLETDPTWIGDLSGVGDEVIVETGCRLSQVVVYPRVRVTSGITLEGPLVLRPHDIPPREVKRLGSTHRHAHISSSGV